MVLGVQRVEDEAAWQLLLEQVSSEQHRLELEQRHLTSGIRASQEAGLLEMALERSLSLAQEEATRPRIHDVGRRAGAWARRRHHVERLGGLLDGRRRLRRGLNCGGCGGLCGSGCSSTASSRRCRRAASPRSATRAPRGCARRTARWPAPRARAGPPGGGGGGGAARGGGGGAPRAARGDAPRHRAVRRDASRRVPADDGDAPRPRPPRRWLCGRGGARGLAAPCGVTQPAAAAGCA